MIVSLTAHQALGRAEVACSGPVLSGMCRNYTLQLSTHFLLLEKLHPIFIPCTSFVYAICIPDVLGNDKSDDEDGDDDDADDDLSMYLKCWQLFLHNDRR